MSWRRTGESGGHFAAHGLRSLLLPCACSWIPALRLHALSLRLSPDKPEERSERERNQCQEKDVAGDGGVGGGDLQQERMERCVIGGGTIVCAAAIVCNDCWWSEQFVALVQVVLQVGVIVAGQAGGQAGG